MGPVADVANGHVRQLIVIMSMLVISTVHSPKNKGIVIMHLRYWIAMMMMHVAICNVMLCSVLHRLQSYIFYGVSDNMHDMGILFLEQYIEHDVFKDVKLCIMECFVAIFSAFHTLLRDEIFQVFT